MPFLTTPPSQLSFPYRHDSRRISVVLGPPDSPPSRRPCDRRAATPLPGNTPGVLPSVRPRRVAQSRQCSPGRRLKGLRIGAQMFAGVGAAPLPARAGRLSGRWLDRHRQQGCAPRHVAPRTAPCRTSWALPRVAAGSVPTCCSHCARSRPAVASLSLGSAKLVSA